MVSRYTDVLPASSGEQHIYNHHFKSQTNIPVAKHNKLVDECFIYPWQPLGPRDYMLNF